MKIKAFKKFYEVSRFHPRWEATGKQVSYIDALCKKLGVELEEVLEEMWGMNMHAAFSDRPWMRLTKNEASRVITALKAETEKIAS